MEVSWDTNGILNMPSGNQTAMGKHPFIDFPATINLHLQGMFNCYV